MRYCLLLCLFALVFPSAASAQATGNLLRNGRFQDDWITLLPQNKNHHWCYADGFYNRRDYNPDGWFLKGSWDWQNADAPMGQRHLVLTGPAVVTQRVNWVTVHDDRSREGFPDAGGFPSAKPQRSLKPLRLVRDLTFRVRLKATDYPANAGDILVAWCPPGGISSSDPMGTRHAGDRQRVIRHPTGDVCGQMGRSETAGRQLAEGGQCGRQKRRQGSGGDRQGRPGAAGDGARDDQQRREEGTTGDRGGGIAGRSARIAEPAAQRGI